MAFLTSLQGKQNRRQEKPVFKTKETMKIFRNGANGDSVADEMVCEQAGQCQTGTNKPGQLLSDCQLPRLVERLWSKRILEALLFLCVCVCLCLLQDRGNTVFMYCRTQERFLQMFERTAPSSSPSITAIQTSSRVRWCPHTSRSLQLLVYCTYMCSMDPTVQC